MVLFVSIAAVAILRGPFGRALAERISARRRAGTIGLRRARARASRRPCRGVAEGRRGNPVNPDDIVGLVAVVMLFGGGTVFLLAISPVGKALAARLSGKKHVDDDAAEELTELRREVEDMRHLPEQLSELGERVDFLERLVAKQREAERLPPAR